MRVAALAPPHWTMATCARWGDWAGGVGLHICLVAWQEMKCAMAFVPKSKQGDGARARAGELRWGSVPMLGSQPPCTQLSLP